MAVGDIVHSTGAAAVALNLQPAASVELLVLSVHGGTGSGGSSLLVGLGNSFVNYAITQMDTTVTNALNCKMGITNSNYLYLYQPTTRVGVSAIQIK